GSPAGGVRRASEPPAAPVPEAGRDGECPLRPARPRSVRRLPGPRNPLLSPPYSKLLLAHARLSWLRTGSLELCPILSHWPGLLLQRSRFWRSASCPASTVRPAPPAPWAPRART